MAQGTGTLDTLSPSLTPGAHGRCLWVMSPCLTSPVTQHLDPCSSKEEDSLLWKYNVTNCQGLCSCIHLCGPAGTLPEDSCGGWLSPKYQLSTARLTPGLSDQICGLGAHAPWVSEVALQLQKVRRSQDHVFWALQEAGLKAQKTLVVAGPSCHWMPSGRLRTSQQTCPCPSLSAWWRGSFAHP